MATAASSGGHQYVSVKLESPRLAALGLAPHLFGSHPVAGSWDPSKALPMERAADAIWELSCVLPSHHETMDFKLVLKQKANSSEGIVEEGPNRPLGCGSNGVEMTDAVFKLSEKDALECKVWVETEMLSPFDLAASWKAHQKNLQPSRVRGTYDVVMDAETECRAKNDFTSGLELDLEKYVVPTTPNTGSGVVYAANLTENLRFLLDTGISSNSDTIKGILHNLVKGDAPLNHFTNPMKERIRTRMINQKNLDTSSSWTDIWGSPTRHQSNDEEESERANRAAKAARRWREYSRKGIDRPPRYKLPEAVGNDE